MLVYGLVSRGKTVLAENTGTANTTGNFEVIARMLLSNLDNQQQKLENQQTRRSIEVENHIFHVLSSQDDGLLFVTLAEKEVKPLTAFAFLQELRTEFTTRFKKKDWEQAIAHSFNADFSGILSLLLIKYNRTEREDDQHIQRIKAQLDDVTDVMKTNIDAMLNRGERIELLVDTTERLTQASFKFQESATRLKNQHWWKNKKNQFTLFAIFVIVVFLILVTSCGGLDFGSC